MQTADDGHKQTEPNTWELLATYFRRPAVLLTILLLATAVLYSGALSFEFVWDDSPQIVDNPLIRSWHNLSRAFVSDLWYHTSRQQVYYRPLFVVWSMLNYAVVGLRPWGWHLGAILLHLGATLAVFWLVRRLGLAYWTAALATVIFALHPVHIECVAWISAGSDSMVTMLTALAFVAFLNASEADRTRRLVWRAASLILLAGALLTKEMAVSFPILVGLYTWLHPNQLETPRSQRLWRSVVAMIPYAAVTVCYAIVRHLVLRNSPLRFDAEHGYADMAFTLPYVLYFYLRKLILPLGLTGLYYTPYVTIQIVAKFVLPLALLVAITALIYYWARRSGNWLIRFAGLWLLVGLGPALYLRNFGNGDFVRDRYMYLPSIGFAILAAIAFQYLPAIKGWSARKVQAASALALCLSYAGASIAQQTQWYNDFLILSRAQQLYPDNPYTLVALSNQYALRGANEKAIELAEKVVREHPEYGYATLALAEAYIRSGRFEAGRQWLEKGLARNPDYATSETGMAALAGFYGRMGDYDRAFAYCGQILTKDPSLYSALYNCGNIHLLDRQYPEAEQLLARAIETAPDEAAPKHFLGRALLLEGRNAEAQPYLRAAVMMDPTVGDYHYWLAESLLKNGDFAAARMEYERTLELNPNQNDARVQLTALEGK